MKKYILLISLLLYASSSNAGSLVIFNNCEYCSSIKVIVTVPATSEDPSYDVEQTLGDYGDSVAFDVPHSGTYWVKANCLSGESYSWNFSVYCSQYSTTEKFLDCAAPTTSSTSTTALTSTSTSTSSTTTTSLKPSTTTTYSSKGRLTFYNYCEDCSSIKIIITVPATSSSPSYQEEMFLDGYHSSIVYQIPHYGYYFLDASCLEGIERSWEGGKSFGTGSIEEIFFYCTEISYHVMTKDPKANFGCTIPVPATTFYYYDTAAYCWMYWINALPTDEIKCKWYKPNGEFYFEYSTPSTYSNACWWPSLFIKGNSPAYISGKWHVDVYVNEIKKFTESFTIVGITSTTSTIRSTTTSSSIFPTTTTTIPAPPPTSTTTSSTPDNPCVIARIYGEDSIEAELLKYIRDTVLSKTPEGQELIKLYYEWSPMIVEMMEQDEEYKAQVKEMIDEVLPLIR